MSASQGPQDEPFNHEAVARGHQRGESSASLLPEEHAHTSAQYDHPYGDDFYSGRGPSQATLYGDPERASSTGKEARGDASTYHQFGTCIQPEHAAHAHDVCLLAEYADEDIYNEGRAKPLPEKAAPFSRFFKDVGQTPLSQRIEAKKRGIGRQRRPYVGKQHCLSRLGMDPQLPAAWTLAAVMLGVFIYELVLNAKAQGTPISFKVCRPTGCHHLQEYLTTTQPVVNPMLGPSGSALINAGARFPPCMKDVVGLPLSTPFPCMSSVFIHLRKSLTATVPTQASTTQPTHQTGCALSKAYADLVDSTGRSPINGSGILIAHSLYSCPLITEKIYHAHFSARWHHSLPPQHVGSIDCIRAGMSIFVFQR